MRSRRVHFYGFLKLATLGLLVFVFYFSNFADLLVRPAILESVQRAEAKAGQFKIKNKEIKFDYTDDNSNENLIIKTDEKSYYGISTSEVLFSVTNESGHDENFGLQAYFPDNNGQVEKIQKWTKNISYTEDVAEFGPVDYGCDDKWEKKSEALDSSDTAQEVYFFCSANKEKKECSEITDGGKTCHVKSAEIGKHKEKMQKDDWVSISTTENVLEKNTSLVNKLIYGSLKEKVVPEGMRIKKSTGGNRISIAAGETQYFKMKMSFSLESAGEFFIEAIGDKNGYGLLDPWYTSNWQYRKRLTINGTTAGAQTNYPMEITVNFGTGTDAGKVVYCGNNCNADFGDVRFTQSDATTELVYWLKSYTASNVATFWVQVNTIPASPGTNTIYMYYGNAAATTTSNGSGMFAFFDDFSSGLGQWTIDPENTDSISIDNSLGYPAPSLRHNPDSTQTKNVYFDSRMQTTTYRFLNGVIEYDVYLAGTPRVIHQLGYRVQSLNFENGYGWRLQPSNGDSGLFRFTGRASWVNFGTIPPDSTTGAWHSIKVTINGNNFTGAIDGGTTYTGTDATKTTLDYLVSHAHFVNADASSYILVDNIRVRSLASPEPTYGAWAAQEARPNFNLSGFRFFNNANSANVGTVLAAQNTAANLTTKGAAFRLRALIHVSNAALALNDQQFKLQFVAKGSGTCASPAGGTPAVYTDVTTTTAISYYNNAAVADGANLTANANDPVHGADTIVRETYEEANNFTDSRAVIPVNQDGKWDFALYDNAAPNSTTYCFRIVKSDGSTLDTYTYYPEITIMAPATLSVDIVDGAGTSLASPTINMISRTFSWNAQQSTGTLGDANQKIRVTNGTGTSAWTLSIAATAGPTALWTSGGNTYDFNGTAAAGRLQVDPSVETIAPQSGCAVTGLTKGVATYFVQGTQNSINLVTAGGTAQRNCYWDMTGINLTQDIPVSQATGNYSISLTVTVM
jgi:hypothetical protein